MAKIIAPNSAYNGESASVQFANGIGETDDPNLITWFKENGYEVESSVDDPRAELESKTVAQLKEMAQDLGLDLGDATKKADIIELIFTNAAKEETDKTEKE